MFSYIEIFKVCNKCNKEHVIRLRERDYIEYLNGKKVQYAFPYLSTSEKNFLVSDICEECFDKTFK